MTLSKSLLFASLLVTAAMPALAKAPDSPQAFPLQALNQGSDTPVTYVASRSFELPATRRNGSIDPLEVLRLDGPKTPVPEPASLFLMGTGFFAMVLLLMRRSKLPDLSN